MMNVDLDMPAATLHEAVSNRSGMPLEGFALYYRSKKLEGEAALLLKAVLQLKGLQMFTPDEEEGDVLVVGLMGSIFTTFTSACRRRLKSINANIPTSTSGIPWRNGYGGCYPQSYCRRRPQAVRDSS